MSADSKLVREALGKPPVNHTPGLPSLQEAALAALDRMEEERKTLIMALGEISELSDRDAQRIAEKILATFKQSQQPEKEDKQP